MLHNSTPLGASRYRVDVRDLPPHLIDNAKNRAWNLRTLALMSRAGLIRLRAEEPPRLGQEATEGERRAAHVEYQNTVIVELTDVDSSDSEAWDRRFEQARSSTYDYFYRSFARVLGLIQGRCPFEQARDTYMVSSFPLDGERELTIVLKVPAGDVFSTVFAGNAHAGHPGARTSWGFETLAQLGQLFRNKSTLLVTHAAGSSSNELAKTFVDSSEYSSRTGSSSS